MERREMRRRSPRFILRNQRKMLAHYPKNVSEQITLTSTDRSSVAANRALRDNWKYSRILKGRISPSVKIYIAT